MPIIFLGGGIGAVFSICLTIVSHYRQPNFPFGIMLINIVGSLVMGLCVGLFAKIAVPQDMRLFLTVGILGGFTTFSAFSLDTVLLLEHGAYAQAALYVAGSVGLSVFGLMAGLSLMRLSL